MFMNPYSTSWFARVVKGEDLRSSVHKHAWVRTPQPAVDIIYFFTYLPVF